MDFQAQILTALDFFVRSVDAGIGLVFHIDAPPSDNRPMLKLQNADNFR